jgi:hypothetical protein
MLRHLGLAPMSGGRWVLTQTNTISVPGIVGRSVARWTIIRKGRQLAISGFTQRVGGYLVEEIRCSAFRPVDGLLLPGTVLAKFWNGKLGLVAKYRLSRIRYRLSPRGNTPKRFLIKFPVGAWVQDMRVAQTFRVTTQPSYLTDRDIFRLLKP